MPALEPALTMHPVARYVAATRPAFLSVTFGACLVGLASAFADGVPIHALKAIVTIAFALVAHAGANVLNDYYDSVSGNDAANQERIFPFTGGSRFIQNGVLTEAQTLSYGLALTGATMAAGLWLMAASGPDLFWWGAAGLFIGWAYSAPPFRLNSRGLGEAAIWVAWMLVATGTDYVQRAAASPTSWIASAGYALLVTNVLLVNQFPDRRADESVGKRHWVVRLGAERARYLYLAIALLAHALVLAGIAFGALPGSAVLGVASLPLSLKAWGELNRHWSDVSRLTGAIRASILAALAHAVLLAAGIAASRWA